ncbi:unnamed protein product, partial [Brassicogethes aeneus]
ISGVPTTVDLENNSNQKKYTVNQNSGKGGLYISKPLCTLMAIGAVLLALLVGLVVFFLVPRTECSAIETVENLTKDNLFKAEEIDERLPRNVIPYYYSIQLLPNLLNETTEGKESIHLNIKGDTNEIIFHLNEIKIDTHSVKLIHNNSEIAIDNQDYIDGQRYKIVTKQPLIKNADYELKFDFTGNLNKHLQGFYKISYQENQIEQNAASTQFSPTDARRAFPCFDEPFFKAQFKIKIGRPSNLISLSNMNLKETSPILEMSGWNWDTYHVTPKMSTYLVAFMVANLTTLSPQGNFIRVWSQPSLVEQTRYVNELAPKILKFFENYFNISFPLPKIDIVAVPEFGFSAMENWGLLTFRESTLLFDESTTTTEQETSIALVLGHEIAHQWFGNLVTPKWWNDLWLKEGFATYLEYLGVNNALPYWKVVDEFVASETTKAFAIDALESSRPISFTVINSRQIRQTFDEISYSKGASLIRMMNHFLGEDTFRHGLINYLNRYKYDNADRDDLFASLTEEAHKTNALEPNDTVKVIMDSWTEQAGFPVVSAIGDYVNGRVKLSQKRFLLTSSKEYDTSWWVPISMTTDLNENFADTKPAVWMRGEKQLEAKIDYRNWYLLNINQTGYYIVNYDERNWRSIIENIMHFPPLTRAQLISDAMDLARASLLDYDIPLRLLSKMAVEDASVMFIPTMVSLNKLKFFNNILSNTPIYGLFQAYHQTIFGNTYGLVKLEEDARIYDYITKRIRTVVLEWSCQNVESPCSYASRDYYRKWMTDRKIIVPKNLRQIVYCTAIREGTHFEWDFAYSQYLKTNVPAEKNVLLDALGCTKEKWLLSSYLDKLIDENSSIRIQDADRVFDSVSRHRVGTSLAFDFLRKHWNKLQEQYGDGFNILAKMVKSLAPNMNSEFQLEELTRFRDSIKANISTTRQGFDSAIETVKANVEWMQKNYDYVEKWLTDHKDKYIF